MSETSEPVADCFTHESIQVALTGSTKPSSEFDKVQHSIAHRFEQQAANYPNRIAVKTTREALTYGDLNQAANRVARQSSPSVAQTRNRSLS